MPMLYPALVMQWSLLGYDVEIANIYHHLPIPNSTCMLFFFLPTRLAKAGHNKDNNNDS
jgi:hypothetical protein